MRCPICDKEFDRADSPAPPFCSDRCRSIDLNRWLGEVYSLPTESAVGNADEFAAEPNSQKRSDKPPSVD